MSLPVNVQPKYKNYCQTAKQCHGRKITQETTVANAKKTNFKQKKNCIELFCSKYKFSKSFCKVGAYI